LIGTIRTTLIPISHIDARHELRSREGGILLVLSGLEDKTHFVSPVRANLSKTKVIEQQITIVIVFIIHIQSDF
jgi:hypothetical protein